MVLYQPGTPGRRVQTLVGSRVGTSLVAALSLWEWVQLGVELPIVEMLSNDARLEDLTAWDPLAES